VGCPFIQDTGPECSLGINGKLCESEWYTYFSQDGTSAESLTENTGPEYSLCIKKIM